MTLFSKRLPHVLTRKELALVVASTYAASANIDFDEAHERMERAVQSARFSDVLYEGLSAALRDRQGPRTQSDDLIDKLSAGLQARRSKVKAAQLTPGVSAVLVLANLELDLAPTMMANALETDKGRALLDKGAQELGAHLLKELIK